MNIFLRRERYEPCIFISGGKTTHQFNRWHISYDDTVIDQPYSDPLLTELISYFWSGKHHRVVKGIQLITLDYTDLSGKSVPVNYLDPKWVLYDIARIGAMFEQAFE